MLTAGSLTATAGLCQQCLSPCPLRAFSAASPHEAARHRPGPCAPQQRQQLGLTHHFVAAPSMGASRYAPAIPSAAQWWNHHLGSAVPTAAAPPKARRHHVATQRTPHRPRLTWVCSPVLRLRCPPPVPNPLRGLRPLQIALRLRIQGHRPARYII
ncbi:hypothetical protein NDU88_003791 [Pleurodeles waltl]|uniref:Uncharacterized protein n=1 Tax=Pleurodeles waltl TaxID=8319 RepID=A0AAV7RDY1_PLEWA|nr:hypothetical protein NDU88_003791 [Pleurodeles waltl]